MAYQIKSKDGEVVTRNGKEVHGADFLGVVKGVSLEDRTLRIIATDETRDRDGDIITMNGWQLDNYIKNPVFLWAHDYKSVPIGAAIKIEKKRNPHRLVLTHKFPSIGVNPFADMILQLYHEKVINAGSVGFIPWKWEEIEDKDDDGPRYFWPRKFTNQELLEHSGCAVPSNPSALQDSVGSAMKSLNIKYDDKIKLYKVVTGEDLLQLGEKEKERASAEIKELIKKGPTYEEETKTQVQVPEKIEKQEKYVYLYEKDGTDVSIMQDDVIIHASGDSVQWKDTEWKTFDLEEDAFVGIKNLIEEILKELVADSLESEKAAYLKRAQLLLKVGAVLNKKNKALLKKASANILEVLENAGDIEGDDAVNQVDDTANDDDKATDVFTTILGEEEKQSKKKAKVAGSTVVKLPVKKKVNEQLRRQKFEELNNKLSKLKDDIQQFIKA